MSIEGLGTKLEAPVKSLAERSATRIENLAQKAWTKLSTLMDKHPADVELLSNTARKVGESAIKLGNEAQVKVTEALREPVMKFIEENGPAIESLGQKLSPDFLEKFGKLVDKTGQQIEREIKTKGFMNLVKESASKGGEAMVELLRGIM